LTYLHKNGPPQKNVSYVAGETLCAKENPVFGAFHINLDYFRGVLFEKAYPESQPVHLPAATDTPGLGS
jgi:hypothetical protein